MDKYVFVWNCCQPPCEAVSWNAFLVASSSASSVSLLVRLWVEILCDHAHPSLSLVSLLVRLWVEIFIDSSFLGRVSCQPPCEAVSWNNDIRQAGGWTAGSASLWGCELKYTDLITSDIRLKSASLWGCELKCGGKSLLHSMFPVSLLVRLWVEMQSTLTQSQ